MIARIAVALALLAAQPGLAGELQWFGGADSLNAELRYSDAGKTDIPIAFFCTPDVDIVYVAYDFQPANATEAMQIDFTLSAGGIDITVGATGTQILLDDGFVLEGQIPFDERFVKFVTSDGVLSCACVEDDVKGRDRIRGHYDAQQLSGEKRPTLRWHIDFSPAKAQRRKVANTLIC